MANQLWANNLAQTYGFGSCASFRSSHLVLGNVWYGDQGSGCGKVIASPGWVGGGDYHLTAGSAAINAGAAQHAPESDLDGARRDSAPDAGAYEYRP